MQAEKALYQNNSINAFQTLVRVAWHIGISVSLGTQKNKCTSSGLWLIHAQGSQGQSNAWDK